MNKFLKIGLAVIILLVTAFFSLLMLSPSSLSTSHSITIMVPPKVVFDQINDFSNWSQWSPWNGKDSNMVDSLGVRYIGTGSTLSWKGDPSKQQSGQLAILESVPFDSISVKLDRSEDATSAITSFKLKKTEKGFTFLTWSHNQKFSGPFNRIIANLGDTHDKIENEYSKGIIDLKSHCEILAKFETTPIQEVNVEASSALEIKIPADYADLEANIAESLQFVMTAMKSQRVMPSGSPYLKWESDSTILLGIPCNKPIEVLGVSYVKNLKTKAITTTHLGNPAMITSSLDSLKVHCQKQALETNGKPWFIFHNSSNDISDPNTWRTQLFQPIL